jgi:predicted glutamine amidotransferase
MCRLFALHAGERDVAAEFWLLDAPTSIARQSERNADGYGMAALTSRRGMILIRNPVIASERISDEPGWEEIHPGELVHAGPDLQVDRETIVSGSPAHPMMLSAREQETQSYD